MPTVTCTNHCGQCGRHFHSLSAFDAHHEHDEDGWPVCLDPLDLLDRDKKERLVALTYLGECRAYDVATDVTIWTEAKGLEKARKHFSALGGGQESASETEAG